MKKIILNIIVIIVTLNYSTANAQFNINARTAILQDYLSAKIL